MRKILIMIIFVVFLGGCASKSDSIDKIKLENYAYIYQTITDNDTFNAVANYYDLQVVMAKISDQQYRYDIIIDNPKIAMYDIKIMAVENNVDFSLADKMMPSIGIFDDEEFNMVPYQINKDLGYVKGLVISGLTDKPIVNLKIRIVWKDYSKVEETKEYFNITIDYMSQTPLTNDVEDEVVDEVIDDVTDEVTEE
ncbi:MAG: hypothetical protein VB009_03560 [Erysipelotrichaceae bacterium]|nr:hypothetical protein [Erysipelotrichaceae bacterium]